MKKYKKILLVFMPLFICLNFLLAVKAYDERGSIELNFHNEQVSQMSFSIYKIGDLIEGSYVEFLPSLSFKELKNDLNSLTTAKECETLIEECHAIIQENNLLPVQTQLGDENGNVKFNDLELGLYLVKQDESSEQFYVETSLISVPMNMTSSLEFNVVASPKYSTQPIYPNEDDVLGDEGSPLDTSDHQNILPLAVSLLVSAFIAYIIFAKKESDVH